MNKSVIHKPYPSFSLYHQAEDYFFTSISRTYRHISDEVCAYFTGVEADSLNLLIVKQHSVNLATTLQNGIQFLDAAGLPFSIVFPGDMVDHVKNQMHDIHFSVAYTSSAMHLKLDNYLPANSHSHNKVEIRCTNDCLMDWAVPLESAFESKPGVMGQYQARHQSAMDAGKRLIHFSVYVNTEPVCSLTLSIHNQLARLDDIGTKVGFQNQGYASALVQHALSFAKSQNSSHCFLEASNDGASIYNRAGFSALFEYTAFHRMGNY